MEQKQLKQDWKICNNTFLLKKKLLKQSKQDRKIRDNTFLLLDKILKTTKARLKDSR